MKRMFNIFTLEIKFDCLFLAFFQSFDWFVSFIFYKLAPPPPWIYVSKDALNYFLVHSSAKKTVSEVLKTRYFSYSVVWSTSQWGGGGGL